MRDLMPSFRMISKKHPKIVIEKSGQNKQKSL